MRQLIRWTRLEQLQAIHMLLIICKRGWLLHTESQRCITGCHNHCKHWP